MLGGEDIENEVRERRDNKEGQSALSCQHTQQKHHNHAHEAKRGQTNRVVTSMPEHLQSTAYVQRLSQGAQISLKDGRFTQKRYVIKEKLNQLDPVYPNGDAVS